MNFGETARLIALTGEDCILRRFTGKQKLRLDVKVKCRISLYQPQELVGNIVQGDQRGIIANIEIETAKWPGPPKRGDLIIRRSGASVLEIQGCETISIAGNSIRHNLQLRGP